MTIAQTGSPLSHEKRQQIQDIQWKSERHSVKIGETVVALTPIQYRLLWTLHTGLPVTYAHLAWTVYQYPVDTRVRMMIDKHIDRIRGKLRGTGIRVYCMMGYGYLLWPEPDPDEAEPLSDASSP